MDTIYSIGHSNLFENKFLGRLLSFGITKLYDVRSSPSSGYCPQFNRETLERTLRKNGIKYVYAGDTMGGHIKTFSEGNLSFTESSGGYRHRTIENAKATDLTVAFASDFGTAGEKCTEEAAKGKIIQIAIDGNTIKDLASIAKEALGLLSPEELGKSLNLNIAGNGIYTFRKNGFTQEDINSIVTGFLREWQGAGVSIKSIRSGGQTGADEAGIIAANELHIPARVHAPKGWMYRDESNQDVCSEERFKSRFPQKDIAQERDLTYSEMMNTEGFRDSVRGMVEDAVKGGEQVAMMCSEDDPLQCHRFYCIGHALEHPELIGMEGQKFPQVMHIDRNGLIHSQWSLERNLCLNSSLFPEDNNVMELMKERGEQVQSAGKEEKKSRGYRR